MSLVRLPVAAGLFYPADASTLEETVDVLLRGARRRSLPGRLRALVVPHAGYEYSGPVAASAFACVPVDEPVFRVALLGPSHFVPLHGLAVSTARAWRTPLGDVAVDDELRATAVAAGAAVDERPHLRDHALEVELPFLQRTLDGRLRVLPVAVGSGPADAVSLVVGALADDAVILVSSDLSHYLDESVAHIRDLRTSQAVVALDDAAIGDHDACGAHALRGLLAYARQAGWSGTLLELRTSADATGDSSRVVGYGAFAFSEQPSRSDDQCRPRRRRATALQSHGRIVFRECADVGAPDARDRRESGRKPYPAAAVRHERRSRWQPSSTPRSSRLPGGQAARSS